MPNILTAGCLQADNLVRRTSALLVEAGDPEIKATRRATGVSVGPRGCVADYVPFYFAPRSPMMYKLWRGGVPSYTDSQESLVYLVSTAEAVAASGVACLFSDGNCAARMTQVFDDLTLLDSVVDWEIMRARIWKDTFEDPDRKRRRMAEFLAHQQVPISCLTEVAVRSSIIEQMVEARLAACNVDVPVRVRPSWYYS